MKVNTAKEKMRRGEPAFGYSLGLGSPLAAEVLANSGIDFILLDTQHGSWGPDTTIMALAAMAAGSAVPMARVAANNYTLIGRLLDEGMLGIVVPMVHTAEDAKAAADACRFPPQGTRSWGWGRAVALGRDYPDWINEQMFVAVQIESAQAVANAEAIMATPGVDGCWVGPADLALSMGIHPREAGQREEHARALEKVVEACRNTGKIPGFAGAGPEDALRRVEQGFRYITAGRDTAFVANGAQAALRTLQSGLGKVRQG
ncbi:MAG: HpcH/HpaI aldolase family protein [Chloroflexota bacterium]